MVILVGPDVDVVNVDRDEIENVRAAVQVDMELVEFAASIGSTGIRETLCFWI